MKLYHGTIIRPDNFKMHENMWFSCEKEQSIYHIFNNGYKRYENLINLNPNKCFWPTLYTFTPISPLKLLEITYMQTYTYNMYSMHETYTYNIHYKSKTYQLNDFIIKFNLKIRKLDNCLANEFVFECNKKLLNMISDNEILSSEFDGYICKNDQYEIALLNPESKLSHLKNLNEELTNIENLNDLNFHILPSYSDYVEAVRNDIDSIFYDLIMSIYDYNGCLKFDMFDKSLREYIPIYHNINKDILLFLNNYIDTIINSSKELYDALLIQNKHEKNTKFKIKHFGMSNYYFDTHYFENQLGIEDIPNDKYEDIDIDNYRLFGIEENEDENKEDIDEEDIDKKDIDEDAIEKDYQNNQIIDIDKICNYELLNNIIKNPSQLAINDKTSISQYIENLLENRIEYYKNINEIMNNYYHYYKNDNYLYKQIIYNILSRSLTLYRYNVNTQSYNMIINRDAYIGLNIIFSSI